MSNILEINNLQKSYGKHTALKGISFSVPTGSIVGVLGPNGSGKTTLIKTITGLLSQYNGTVTIGSNMPGHIANADISYLPDKGHIPTWLKVREALSFFMDFYKDFDKQKAQKMIQDMNLPLDKKLKDLSRGQQEKVSLALVMSRKAKLYILDEPIGAVDPASRDFIIQTIIQNYDRQSSILISTHIISEIEPILDAAIFLKEGEIILQGEVDDIREEKQSSLDELFREVFRNA